MRKLIAIIVLLAVTGFTAHANYVPGYLGKRLSVGVNASSFFMFEDFNSISDMLFSTRFSYKTEVALNYTVARRITLGGSFYIANQKYLAGGGRDVIVGNNSYELKPKDDYIHCKLMIFEANIKIFRRNFIAPIGPYHQIGVGLVKYQANEPGDTLRLVNVNHPSSGITVDIPSEKYSGVKLSYHIGYAAPVFSNCYFNFAIGVNFFRGGDTAKIRGDVPSSEYVLAEMNKHLRRHNFFEVKIGFGWLAF